MHTVLKNDIFCRIAVQDQTPGFIGAGVQKAAFYVNYLLFTNTNINNMKHTLLIAVTAYWLVLFLPLKILVARPICHQPHIFSYTPKPLSAASGAAAATELARDHIFFSYTGPIARTIWIGDGPPTSVCTTKGWEWEYDSVISLCFTFFYRPFIVAKSDVRVRE